MSMHPSILLVVGLSFKFKDVVTERQVTKYDEDTGKPYQKTLRERDWDIPKWLQEAMDDKRENCDDWHRIGDISVYPDQCSGTYCMVGKLLAMEDPREMGDDDITVEMPTEDDKKAVLKYIQEWGAEGYTLDDIKLRIGTQWF